MRVSLNEINEWCQTRVIIPEDDDKVYVGDYHTDYTNNELTMRIFLTTKRLMSFCDLSKFLKNIDSF